MHVVEGEEVVSCVLLPLLMVLLLYAGAAETSTNTPAAIIGTWNVHVCVL